MALVLTFNNPSLEYWFKTYQDVGKALKMYFDKIRKKFRGVKYFWKYEEGTKVWCKVCNKKMDFVVDDEREGWVFCSGCGSHIKGGERPHFHVLFDFVNRGVRCRKDKVKDTIKRIGKKKVRITPMTDKTTLIEWTERSIFYNKNSSFNIIDRFHLNT